MSEITIRAAMADDAAFLEDMLVEAANWATSPAYSRAETLSDPAFAHYIDGWPRATDMGVVAVDENKRSVGAAWLRYFNEADPGYGFVRADIPALHN